MKKDQREMSSSEINDVEKLKKVANEYFAQKNYKEADDMYTLAVENLTTMNKSSTDVAGTNELHSVILANRSAARIGLSMFELALPDAEESIRLQPFWIKAYFRKASALEGMNKFNAAMETWEDARTNCPVSEAATVDKQLKLLKKKWSSFFLSEKFPIESEVDLLSRYSVLSDKRERLSTLAHFWNDSNKEERFGFFQLLMGIIGGESGASNMIIERVTSDVMADMPLHNYTDLPRERVALWCDYFKNSLDMEGKNLVFQAIWNKLLTTEEKTDIIMDMKLLFNQSLEIPESDASEAVHETD
jgi:tetratricopeptide (TPR) repeat protein